MQSSGKVKLNLINNTIQTPSGNEAVPLGSGVITALLGNGGMARVYEIWNQELEVHRAVKLLHPNCNLEALQRFQTEIKITAKFHHPNIIEIHGIGTWNELPYIEMEKAEGFTLEELIRKRGALPITVSLAIGIMISKALEYAHNHEYILYNKSYHGIIHRDLKPGNIMVSPSGCAKLMDFGIARPTDASFHTIDGTILGTLQYLSPEQLEGQSLDIRTDLYSLGVCLYEMASGAIAFPETNITRLLSDKSKNKYKPLSDYEPKIPAQYISIAHKCMHHDKKNRVQDSNTLQKQLAAILVQYTTQSPEEIVEQFMQTDSQKHTTLLTLKNTTAIKRRNFSILTAFFFLATFLTILLIVHNKKALEKEIPSKNLNKETLTKNNISDFDSLQSNALTIPDSYSIKISSTSQTQDKTPPEKSNKQRLRSSKTSLDTKPEKIRAAVLLTSKLQRKYNTSDKLVIMQQEVTNKNFSNVIILFDELPPETAASVRAQILWMRAVKVVDPKAYSSFLSKTKIQEAEILINRARLFCKLKNTSDALLSIEKATKAQRELLTYEQANIELIYLKAVCTTQLFDKKPDQDLWKVSVGAWYLVKKNLRTEPKHPYYLTAEQEIIRIGEKFRSQQN